MTTDNDYEMINLALQTNTISCKQARRQLDILEDAIVVYRLIRLSDEYVAYDRAMEGL